MFILDTSTLLNICLQIFSPALELVFYFPVNIFWGTQILFWSNAINYPFLLWLVLLINSCLTQSFSYVFFWKYYLVVLVLTFRTVNYIVLDFTVLSGEGRGSLLHMAVHLFQHHLLLTSFPVQTPCHLCGKPFVQIHIYGPHSGLCTITLM